MGTTRKKPGGAEQKRFGAHMSIAGGMHLAVERAVEAGCDCFQVFVKNQRQWKARPFTETEISEWKSARRAAGREPVIAHDTYLINLAAPDEKIRRASIEAFLIELLRCEQLEIGGLVAHPGAHLGQGEPWGLKRIAESLDEIHAAAGYDLVTPEGYADTMKQLDRIIGIRHVRCIHTNDSKTPQGSRVDRHAHIGEGTLGRAAFRNLVNDPRFFGVPMILETPKGTDEKGRDLDRKNLAALRRLIGR
jgi:deoxyribonuclease-4